MSSIEQVFSKSFIRVVPRIDIDSILAASIMLHNLPERGVDVAISFDTTSVLEAKEEVALLGLPQPKGAKAIVLGKQPNSTLTGSIVYEMERKFGVHAWDKVLSVAAGVYEGVDVGREGPKGVEKSILNELLTKGLIEQELGFRLWGYKRVSILKALTRTIIPPLPGLTGREDVVMKILAELKLQPTVRASETGVEQDPNLLRKFILLLESNIVGDKALKEKIERRLVGYVYTTTINGTLVDLVELLGAFMVYLSLAKGAPYQLLEVTLHQRLAYDFLNVYEDAIDTVARAISTPLTSPSRVVEMLEPMTRPELLVEALRFIYPIESRKPIIVRRDGELMTTVGELLRAGYTVEEVYDSCGPDQLCRVREDGSLVKA